MRLAFHFPSLNQAWFGRLLTIRNGMSHMDPVTRQSLALPR